MLAPRAKKCELPRPIFEDIGRYIQGTLEAKKKSFIEKDQTCVA